jgi:hypothetical protein
VDFDGTLAGQGHRRMERRGAQREVANQPAGIDELADLADAVDRQEDEPDVGEEVGSEYEREQGNAGLGPPADKHELGDHGHEEEAGERVGYGDIVTLAIASLTPTSGGPGILTCVGGLSKTVTNGVATFAQSSGTA